ncbi:helix-turn-helix domain-containing protein [Salinimicrobium sp. HB62]|uniref:helix-turn-helix domain-containing protein n=1 Tax=Salinimicrobium sp. HB62 TaxID=3077781 RepID=UPI002D78224B|nr:AraC family transcriptional regulator [Salinimicrobium sp. HB62]
MFQVFIDFKNIDDFVPNLAGELDVEYKNDFAEFSLSLPSTRGSGLIKGVQFPNGIALYHFSCIFKEDTEISTKHLVINPIRIVHCLKGNVTSTVTGKTHTIHPHQYIIVSPKADEYHTLHFEKNEKYQFSFLEINRSAYVKSLPYKINDTDPLFYNLFHNSNILDGKLLPSSFSISTSEAIKAIRDCSLYGLPRTNFLGGKALEMLSNTLKTYQEDVIHDRRKGFTEVEYKLISAVADEINNNIGEKRNNSELATMVGMNVNKLQKCFQQVYGKTLNEYVRDVRLSRALDMLQSKEHNINEVVYAVGLNSHSYFSRLFKEKYGISPRDLLITQNKAVETVKSDSI